MAQLRSAAHYSGAAAARLEGESQAGLPVDARRQPALCAEAEVRGDYGFQPRPQGISEFVYLAVVIDAFSRRVIGWALDVTLEDDLPLAALRMALELRRPAPGLVHHSDRGSQYASGDYTGLLKVYGFQISMSHKASPWENAGCESWMKTLKAEEVYRQEYRDLREARASIAQFIDEVYNQKRLHSALGYRPPVEFEQALAPSGRMEAGA